jgi:DNA-binding transcriptional LysR family regulator
MMARDPVQDLDLNLLITLEALLRHGSVTRAAQDLDVTQSAVSHSLRKLRVLFSDQLFLKGKSGVVPTERAKALAEPVRRILGIARHSLFGDTSFDPASAERMVTLCTSDMGEVSLLPLLVERLRVLAPLCTVRTIGLNMADIGRGLETGELDLVLSGPLKLPGAILQQRIYTHSFSVIVSPDSDAKEPLTLERYQAMEHVSIAPAFPSRSHGNLAWHALDIAPNVYLTTSHMTAAPWIVARSRNLVATVPTQLAETFTALGIVRTVETAFPLPALPIYQFWHRRFAEDRFGIWFRAFVRDTVSDHPELNVPV